jgi:predicted RNA-binding protein with PUA-like domain
MKWFKRMVTRWVREDWESVRVEKSHNTLRAISMSDDVDSDHGLNITVRNATGGRIVTFRHYDHKTDRHQHRLYVIPEDHDFERELGKLITLESLKG